MKNRSWIGTLTVLNTFIFCCLGLPAAFTDPHPVTFISRGFFALAYIAQFFAISCLASVIVWLIFLGHRSARLKNLLAIVFLSVTFLFTYLNAKVFAFWRDYVNEAMLNMYFTKGGSQVFVMDNAMNHWITVVIFLCVVLSVTVLFLSKYRHRFLSTKIMLMPFVGIYIAAQVIFAVLCAQNAMQVLQYTIKIPYFYTLSWAHVVERMGVSLFPADSMARQLQITLRKKSTFHYPLHTLQFKPPAHPLNVMLIVVDTLRYDMIHPDTMPNVARFAKQATQFLHNDSGGDCTRPGIFSLLYGIPATYWDAAFSHQTESVVMRAFQANHYQLGLFASAPLTAPPFQKTVFLNVNDLQLMTSGQTALERDATITLEMQRFLQKAAANHRPFFGFLFYDAPHAYNSLPLHSPFSPTHALNYFHIHNDSNPVPIFNLYKNAVFADDQLIENILHALKTNHLMQNTVVIITSDHGQEFNEYKNNYWEHASGFSKYQMQTPMIIAWPHQAPAVVHYHTSHFDLAPTLLTRVLGVKNPASDYSVGQDFFSPQQAKFLIVGNYAYFARIDDNNIMLFHRSGLYRFTTLDMTPLPIENRSSASFDQMKQEMTRF